MALSLLGYFFCMITVLTAVVGVMIGFFNISTSEGVRHFSRPVIERTVAATNREPRLFMVAPQTKDVLPAKTIEDNSPTVEKADAKKRKPHKPKMFARLRHNYYGRGYGNALGYAQETQYGPKRLFSNW